MEKALDLVLVSIQGMKDVLKFVEGRVIRSTCKSVRYAG